MAVNRGKQFEDVIRESFEKLRDVSVDRLHDQTNGYKGSSNICDFIVYNHPTQYYIECKSCHGNTLSIYSNNPKKKYGDISNIQWEGLLKKSEILGVQAGYIVWFIDHDITVYIPAWYMKFMRDSGNKSVNVKMCENFTHIEGKKKRVFFDYDMKPFLNIEE